jgi:hypothetical protein
MSNQDGQGRSTSAHTFRTLGEQREMLATSPGQGRDAPETAWLSLVKLEFMFWGPKPPRVLAQACAVVGGQEAKLTPSLG